MSVQFQGAALVFGTVWGIIVFDSPLIEAPEFVAVPASCLIGVVCLAAWTYSPLPNATGIAGGHGTGWGFGGETDDDEEVSE